MRDERSGLRAVPDPDGRTEEERRRSLSEAVAAAASGLQLGRMALQWAGLVPFDALEGAHPRCGACRLWGRPDEEGREAAVWLHAEWCRGQPYRYLAAGLDRMVEEAPSAEGIRRHFAGEDREGRRPQPPHIGLKLALARKRSERWMAEAVARAEDEAARIPSTFRQGR